MQQQQGMMQQGGMQMSQPQQQGMMSMGMQQMQQPMTCVASDKLGKAIRVNDAAGRYIEFCKGTFPSDLSLRGLKIVVDCAHGATYHIAPNVLSELGADVIEIGTDPNGININHKVGATSMKAIVNEVLENNISFVWSTLPLHFDS